MIAPGRRDSSAFGDSIASASDRPENGRRQARIVAGTAVAAASLLILGFGVWGTLLLVFEGPGNEVLRLALAVTFALGSMATLALLLSRRRRRCALGAFAMAISALVALWTSLTPTNDRDWQPEVRLLAYATINGDEVTVHNIRNFDYRSETDYTVAYYDKQFDLRELRSVDIVTSYWMGPAIAHVFLSFGFAGDAFLAVSVEVRKSRGSDYSTLKGFFRQYELVYVVADERDVIRVRTNYRQNPREDVYVYRVRGSTGAARRLFVETMRHLNSLVTRPEFYNTLTTNCTTNIWVNDQVNPGRVPMNWKIIASGYVPEYLYERGRLQDMGLNFPELRDRAHINDRARAADSAPDFSRRIRASLD